MALNPRVFLSAIIVGLLFNLQVGQAKVVSPNIAALPDGTYQVCSQPKPNNWRDGEGVCFVFVKQRDRVTGYYGYPHSDAFVCVRGSVRGDRVRGEAYLALWDRDPNYEVPTSAFHWDDENRLLLSEGKLIRYAGSRDSKMNWVRFGQANLDVSRFYRYQKAQMTPPTRLCDWKFN